MDVIDVERLSPQGWMMDMIEILLFWCGVRCVPTINGNHLAMILSPIGPWAGRRKVENRTYLGSGETSHSLTKPGCCTEGHLQPFIWASVEAQKLPGSVL